MRKPTRRGLVRRLRGRAGCRGGIVAAACAAAAALVGCASPPPAHLVAQAERKLAEGNARRAVWYSEQALYMSHANPSHELAALHVEVLRAQGRDVEADAFAEFFRRFASGADTDVADTTPSWRECIRPEVEDDRPRHRWQWRDVFDIGTIAAAFQISEDGTVSAIRVMRARHPASAWLLIRAVAAARVYDVRLRELREDPDVTFPLSLCVWLDQDAM